MKRTPRGKPDLRLAESYIPAAVTWMKGMLYTSALCIMASRYPSSRWAIMLPIISLYYDHLWWAPSFIDSSSVCTDIVIGTILMQQNGGGGGRWDKECVHGMICWFVLIVWSVGGSIHIYVSDASWPKSQHSAAYSYYYYHMCSHILPIGCLVFLLNHMPMIIMFIPPSPTSNNMTMLAAADESSIIQWQQPLIMWPFYCRSACYLWFVIIDSYTLRPPTQREKDRIGMVRYGSLLMSPASLPLLACTFILGIAQISRLYYYYHHNLMMIMGGGDTSNHHNNNNGTNQQQHLQGSLPPSSSSFSSLCAKSNSPSLFLQGQRNTIKHPFHHHPHSLHLHNNNTNINNINNNNGSPPQQDNNNNLAINIMTSSSSSLDNNNNNSSGTTSSSSVVDNLDVNEAFRLAKLQFMNGKATL